MRKILKGAECYTASGFQRCDVAIEGSDIVAVEPTIEVAADDEVIDVDGCLVFPGLVDVHVHLREPGFSSKETIKSGTAAAARGGYTTVYSMPNLNPAPDSVDNLMQQLDIIEKDALIQVIPYASITLGQKGKGELVDFEALAPMVGGFSDDGRGVQSAELMQQAMERAAAVKRPIVAHCEVDDLLHGGYIHDGEYAKAHDHKGICSESEWQQVERDVELMQSAGCQYHVCHVSTKESVQIVREAKAKGLSVSCETAPHYLLLTDADLQEHGRFKMNPPLRSEQDQLELINGIIDGSIEVIATDHAPHTEQQKSMGLKNSAFGIVGIEDSFALLYTYLVKRGVITLEKLVELMSVNPRRLFELEGGHIAVGQRADIAIFDPSQSRTVDPAQMLSQGKSTPFEGWEVQISTRMTIYGGDVVYNDKK